MSTPSRHENSLVPSNKQRQSLEHFTDRELASRLAAQIGQGSTNRFSALHGNVIGIGGPIGAGKTSWGSAVVLAFDRDGHSVDFQPERVNEQALGLYIGGQRLNSAESRSPILYNRRFFDPKAIEQVIEQDRALPTRFKDTATRNPYATSFQIKMLSDCQHRVKAARVFADFGRKKNDGPLRFALVDRTPWDNTVFEEANRLLFGSITTEEHRFYRCTMGCAPAFGVDKFVYLECSPDKTLQRVGCRGSPAEQAYQLTYITFLHDIWFHRIVEHHCRRNTKSSTIQRYFGNNSGENQSLQIRVVMWNDFGSAQSVLERCIDQRQPTEIFFFNATDADCPSKALDWDKLYARASVEQRQQFKTLIMQQLSDCVPRIDFKFH